MDEPSKPRSVLIFPGGSLTSLCKLVGFMLKTPYLGLNNNHFYSDVDANIIKLAVFIKDDVPASGLPMTSVRHLKLFFSYSFRPY